MRRPRSRCTVGTKQFKSRCCTRGCVPRAMFPLRAAGGVTCSPPTAQYRAVPNSVEPEHRQRHGLHRRSVQEMSAGAKLRSLGILRTSLSAAVPCPRTPTSPNAGPRPFRVVGPFRAVPTRARGRRRPAPIGRASRRRRQHRHQSHSEVTAAARDPRAARRQAPRSQTRPWAHCRRHVPRRDSSFSLLHHRSGSAMDLKTMTMMSSFLACQVHLPR